MIPATSTIDGMWIDRDQPPRQTGGRQSNVRRINVQTRVLHRILAILLVSVFALPAAAQYSRDASANKKIDEAINTHYLMMDLDKAEEMLVGIVDACEMQCSPSVKAKAWMYVGIVRGSGKSDLGGADEAFATAKAYDPNVRLDEALATPETKATFDGAGGETVAEVPAAAAAPAPVAAAPILEGDIPGGMNCTPEEREILTRMPIPISCTSDMGATSAMIKFKEFGGSDWKEVEMTVVGEYFQAEIPCNLTNIAGPLEFYVGARDASGEYIDQYGSRKQPASFNLSDTAGSPAPAFPGGEPVTRCASAEDCPPDFPGCGGGSDLQCGDLDWGASCDNSSQCKCGLSCDSGTCVQAQACSADDECSGKEICSGGYCSVPASAGSGGPYKKHWLGASFGADVTVMGGPSLCTVAQGDAYSSYCLNADGSRNTDSDLSYPSSPTMGQLRFKVSYDYALTEKMLLGARLGIAFLNGPSPSAAGSAAGVNGFFPVHLEGRFTYNFTPLGKEGFRPAVFVNGGVAEVSTGVGYSDSARNVTIHKVAGLGFVGGGANIGYALSDHASLGVDVGVQILFGSYAASVAFHPALSFVYGL